MSKFFQHPNALINPAAKIGEGTRLWAFVNVMDGVKIGRHCNVCDGCFIEKGAVIGDHVTLKNGIAVYDGVALENDVFCGPHVSFTNDLNPRSNRAGGWKLVKTLVKKGATIGANATIVCGVTIGEYAFVGAGSVVTKDIPAHTMVVGNPARFKSFVCTCGLPLKAKLSCTCGLKYKKNKGKLAIVKS